MPSPFRKAETRRLHGSDIKRIVLILRNDIHNPMDSRDYQYENATQCAIKRLPRRLRSTLLSSHGLLCRSHKGLDVHLIEDIWAWIKFELEIAVGRFVYPIIMTDVLSEADESRVRQLEPVVEMFLPGWTLARSAPPGKQPINTGTKWAYQENNCPACMLARIGSDKAALYALFAGMYGHLRPRSRGQKGVDKIKSKRLRFVHYWMRTHPNGDQAAQEAYDLGVKLKALRPDAKTSLRRAGQHTRYTHDTIDEPSVTDHYRLDEQPDITADLSTPYNTKEWLSTSLHDSSSPHTSTTPSTASRRDHERLQHTSINLSSPILDPTILIPSSPSASSDILSPLPQLHHTALPLRPSSSVYAPSHMTSIASYNAPGSETPARCPRGHDPLETMDERVDKYRRLVTGTSNRSIANTCEGGEAKYKDRVLPKPSRGSMYAGFGVDVDGEEEFEKVADWTPVSSPVEEGFWGGEEEEYGWEDEGVVVLPLLVRR
ncbi:hypothetical protein SVAN01_07413 [Stagonosporopsis vannaccii]|nr:hypothetical protein SVAN01_07413 [Stagonosporopsis vannaccii]